MSISLHFIWKSNKKGVIILNFFLSFLPILCGKIFAFTAECDDILGKWYTDKKDAIFEFFKKDDEYIARLIPLKNPDCIDSLNPIDSLRTRKLYNIIIIKGLKCNKNKEIWEGGTIYNPTDGKTYKCICKIIENKTKLMIRGFLGITLLGETRIFTRE